MTPEEHSEAVFLLGPWFIGCYLEVFLQGVIFCQLSHYISLYPGDYLRIQLSVVGIAVLTTLKSIQSFALIWIQLIENFTDLEAAINLNYTSWLQTGNPLMVAVVGIYVQTFFLHRLWTISRMWWIVAIISVILLFAFLSVVLATYYITTEVNERIAMWFAAHLSSVFAGDLLLSLSTIYFLLNQKKHVFPQTAGVLSALIRLTFQASIPAAICAMLNLIFSQVYPGTEKIISTAFNQMLPKLYAISMLWTVNARREIRATQTSSAIITISGSDGAVRARRHTNEELELNSTIRFVGGIHVHTELESQRDFACETTSKHTYSQK